MFRVLGETPWPVAEASRIVCPRLPGGKSGGVEDQLVERGHRDNLPVYVIVTSAVSLSAVPDNDRMERIDALIAGYADEPGLKGLGGPG